MQRLVVLVLLVLVAAWSVYYTRTLADAAPAALYLAFVFPIILLGDPRWRGACLRRLPHSWIGGLVVWAVIFALVMASASSTQLHDGRFLALWGAYLALPIVLWTRTTAALRLLLTAAAIVIPYGIVPVVKIAAPGHAPLNIAIFAAALLGLSLLLLYRPEETALYRLQFSRTDILVAARMFAIYAAIALPLGLLLRFVRPGFGEPTVGAAVVRLFEIYLVVAIPEELVARGLLQNGLERQLGAARGLWLAAVIFGLSHLGHDPAPNWRYALLATGAGLAYGRVFQQTRNIAVSAMVHALVDWTWFVLLAGTIAR